MPRITGVVPRTATNSLVRMGKGDYKVKVRTDASAYRAERAMFIGNANPKSSGSNLDGSAIRSLEAHLLLLEPEPWSLDGEQSKC